MNRLRMTFAAALLAGVALSGLPSRATTPAAVTRTGTFTTALVRQSLDALIPSCTLHVHWQFSGYQRTNGTIYGTFFYYSEDTCTHKMVWLTTQSNMHKAPNKVYPTGGRSQCGVDQPGPTGTCYHVRKDSSTYCDPCNGAWSMDGYWELRFPTLLTYVYGPVDPRVVCTKTLNGKLKCTGHNLAPTTFG